MSRLERAACIADLRRLAKRRLPRFAFDFIDGGAESERNLERNQRAFEEIELGPRCLVDVSSIDLETELFGRTYAVPFGKAPIGFLNSAWPGSDLRMAELAGKKRMAYGISTASSTVMERLFEAAEGYAWFQIYVSDDKGLVDNLLGRAQACGCEVLLVTVDASLPGKRDRDIRNGLEFPFRLTPKTALSFACNASWTLQSLAHGRPDFANLKGALAEDGTELSLFEVQTRMISARFGWDDLKRLRDRWPASLVLKGVMNADDAERAVGLGCDGILVSNHGGRQADYAPASIEALPAIAQRLSGRVPLLIDSGVRRGADIVRAKALGASMAFAGRAFAYGLAAGEDGHERSYEILHTELVRALGQLGRARFSDVDASVLV